MDQRGQPIQGILAVSLPGPEPLGPDNQDPVTCDPFPGQGSEASLNIRREGRRPGCIKTELDRGGHLVDVLAPRP